MVTRFMINLRNTSSFFILSSLLLFSQASEIIKVCEDGKTCELESAPPLCDENSRCMTNQPFYRRGGSAQSYTPDAPIKNTICDYDLKSTYNPSTWPFGRKSKRTVPKLKFHLQLFQCKSTISERDKKCCCTPIIDVEDIKIEVWQAKPNGQYSSISKRNGICRATLNSTTFTTLAPGSSGILGGLGPNGWDFMPYGVPAIHLLFTSRKSNYHPLLIHLPILLDEKQEPRSFFGPDFRGPAYVTPRNRGHMYSLEAWGMSNDTIEWDVNVYLNEANGQVRDISQTLCPSSLYGTPSSFFLEPISICAPSLLAFFDL
jgi:hypothetical protein